MPAPTAAPPLQAVVGTRAPSTLSAAVGRAGDFFAKRGKLAWYRAHPVDWVRERLNGFLWSKQQEIMELVRDHKYVAIRSGHGVGKSAVVSMLIQWWIESHADVLEDTIVITTAPSNDQVVGIVWEYVRKSHQNNNLLGTVTEKAEWKDDARNLIGKGRKPAEGNPSSFQGRHYKYTLAIIDEACGVSDELFKTVDAIITTDTCRLVAIGNPTDPNTFFGNIFLANAGKGLPDWKTMKISVFDSPNFTGEVCPPDIAALLTAPAWAEKKLRDAGGDEHDPDYMARVLGEFPEASEHSLFPVQLLYRSSALDLASRDDYPAEPTCVFGVDVARYGNDASAIVMNRGGVLTVLDVYKNHDGPESARRIHEWALKHKPSEVRVDATGVGSSVIDHLMLLAPGYGYTVIEMVGSASSPDRDRWYNARAWWHANAKQLMIDGALQIPDPAHDVNSQLLFDEMVTIQYKMNVVTGALQIESKDEMRRRNVKSPDVSDAAMYACAPVDTDNPLAGYDPGDIVAISAYDLDDVFSEEGWAISPV